MKFFFKALTFFCLLILVVGGVFFLNKQPEPGSLISPVLGTTNNKIATNIWFPVTATESAVFTDAPEVTAQAAFFVDMNSGEILFEKNSKERLRIASLVKIMTAIVALENKSMTDEYMVSLQASETEPDKMFLQPGEKLTLEELLSGIFLISANDASETLAEGTFNSRATFIQLMNEKARALGMNNTLFINPSGLEEDLFNNSDGRLKEHYSTAYEVALMSRYLIKNWPDVLKISSSDHIFLPRTQNHQDYDMYTGINLVTTHEGVLGLKTGYTPEAGLTLVTVARREDSVVIGVLLNSQSRRDDARLLLEYSFKKLGYTF